MDNDSSLKNGQESSVSAVKRPRKKFVGRKEKPTINGSASHSSAANAIPADILGNADLNHAIAKLPHNYSFEIHKTIHHLRKNNPRMVALQMPEGLQMFACTIADIIEQFTDALTVIMGDVTYGACCIDDYTASALGCDMLIHYGHSCLVPIDTTTIKTLYIFVEISVDSGHLLQTVRMNLPNDRNVFAAHLLSSEETAARLPAGRAIISGRHLCIENPSSNEGNDDKSIPTAPPQPTRLALVSTIQFAAALHKLKEDLSVDHSNALEDASLPSQMKPFKYWTGRYEITIPRSKPLSPGEILGCTAPILNDVDAILYLGDGRFHLESIMIANPSIPAFRYDPYSKKLTREHYGHEEMKAIRDDAIRKARLSISSLSFTGDTGTNVLKKDSRSWGLILGTLGRQGSLMQLQAIRKLLRNNETAAIPHVPILLSELSPAKLALFNEHVSAYVQTSCPRLSIDWGHAFNRPLLNPYEAAVAVRRLAGFGMKRSTSRDEEEKEGKKLDAYPMDFYAAGGLWARSRISGEL